MWQQKSEQKKFKVGEVSIGGTLGESPTVLVGSIFYHRQKTLGFQEETGDFNRSKAEELMRTQEEFSDKTGLPCMLDVVLPSKKWVSQLLDFITSVTSAPIFVDAPSAEVRVAGLDYAKQTGILNRCVYNSLTPESKSVEYEKIMEAGIESAVLLAFNAKSMTVAGRIEAIKQLLPRALQSGIKKILVDTCVLDVPTLGSAFKATLELKSELGYPTGCGAHNAIGTWKGLRTKMGLQAVKPCIAVANALTVAAGADWILYGPIEDAPFVFPAVALVDSAFAQLRMENGKMPAASHPIFRIA
ncbi:MAG TPA: tetrahydromethanopterin S-methyltransferase subunit H [Candidatus Bathyarchaeia archaeon]|nr:tetrahydromethanopterin S-methyltransferase subunit H [Candidatus Bathyarchaeia archaeon]